MEMEMKMGMRTELELPQQNNLKQKLAKVSIPREPSITWYESLFARIGETLRKEKEGRPTLTEEFKKKISELGGTNEIFIYQKALFATDLTQNHNRLSMPLKQIKTENFLEDHEITLLNKTNCYIEVSLLQPSLKVWKDDIYLARWDMHKHNNSGTCSMYILRGTWFRMAKANNLKVNDVIQVWSFRVQGKLWIALVKV
ncbi:hypothetical protein L6164_003328 [Bauhinia variegata]|uniref:Uncharacterized protein n=1 Tax=Bauhinia variegata TaxID=167791 RepID=A0ACB9Q150_BAUVA|nr:hypothetical protein L6164_003328 [Bauhinia variegata]